MKFSEELLKEICEYLGSNLQEPPCQIIREYMRVCPNCEIYIDKIKRTIEIYHVADQCEPLPEILNKKIFACLKLDDLSPDCQ